MSIAERMWKETGSQSYENKTHKHEQKNKVSLRTQTIARVNNIMTTFNIINR